MELKGETRKMYLGEEQEEAEKNGDVLAGRKGTD